MIGDSLNRDVAGARDAGIRTIWINRYQRTLGMNHPIPISSSPICAICRLC